MTVSKQRFIPYRKSDIVSMCCEEGHLSNDDLLKFQDVCKLLDSIFHFKFHKSLELLKDNYAAVNPDADTKLVYEKTSDQKNQMEAVLISELKKLLNTANFEVINQEDLDRALQEESLFKIRLNVDFNDFEQVLFFRRGESEKHETLVSFFGLKKKPISFINYDRVVIYVKYKDQKYFDQQQRKNLFFKPGSTTIKLFQNIPRSDLEMLFPNTKVKMKTIDKLIIGVPAAVGGIIMLATKLGATLILTGSLLAFWFGLHHEPVVLDQAALLGLVAGFGTLGAFLWKQFSNFKNRKIKFMKTLADSLYFKNLDNNTGVFHQLIDAAEEEECKEAILAYYFLLRSDNSLTTKELDHSIENWFKEKYQHSLDFEISDALRKLEELELIKLNGDQISVVPPAGARIKLDQIWDGYFQFSQA
ncbi:MAG: TMEM143 family protein [Gammaproteobacteria bacterium]